MRSFLTLLVIVAGLELALAEINGANCGNRPLYTGKIYADDGKIIGGSPAVDGDHPWQVAILISSNFVCGGSIIDEFTVLTSANCIPSSALANYRIQRTNNRVPLSTWAQTKTVKKIVIHPNYNTRTFENDLSLIFLNEAFDFSADQVGPICLATQDPQALDIALASGFGSTTGSGSLVNGLREVYLNITDDVDVRAQYGNSYFPATMIGAGHRGDGKDSCQGDTGGPLSVEFDAVEGFKRVKQVGISSWGYGCGDTSIYVRVSAYIDWIEGEIAAFRKTTLL